MTNPELLKQLLKGDYSSLTIGYNDEHSCNYTDAQGWHDKWGMYGADQTRDECRIDWASEEERLRAIRENSVWIIQWYPHTPVGFYCVGASTFEAAATYALKCGND